MFNPPPESGLARTASPKTDGLMLRDRCMSFFSGDTPRRRWIPAPVAAAILFLVAGPLCDAASAQYPQNDQRLTCFVLGGPGPMQPTDGVTFKGSDAWARVGVNRRFGGVAVELDLINPRVPDAPLPIVEARSAAGAAWQSTVGVADAANNRIVHFNQAAGNSAALWGYESAYQISPVTGFLQQDWLPLHSNDYRQGLGFDAPDVRTSPCRGPRPNFVQPYEPGGFQIGDGKGSIIPTLVAVGDARVLQLANSYSVRAATEQKWKWIDTEQALYITEAAARTGDLRVYIAQPGTGMIGPIRLIGDKPNYLRGEVGDVAGNSEDWVIRTKPASYVVLVFKVGGEDIGIGVRQSTGHPFMGLLRFRPHAFCRESRDECGSVQLHIVTSSRFDGSVQTDFKAGEISTRTILYDIAPLSQLSALGLTLTGH